MHVVEIGWNKQVVFVVAVIFLPIKYRHFHVLFIHIFEVFRQDFELIGILVHIFWGRKQGVIISMRKGLSE